ncbi:hypothetical protein IY145_04610 [Methylosinus sp. H3A]|uniref:hypothetical protein n=1 Tax=Methylosinus sp. H3A TaxID=2785786 RepID=UPI0018C24BE5|nr:hypothetical protein [Methylosinus sp. H3A]MBG0808652.1 hypothetical protein [Methylosinus sp. H3A]
MNDSAHSRRQPFDRRWTIRSEFQLREILAEERERLTPETGATKRSIGERRPGWVAAFFHPIGVFLRMIASGFEATRPLEDEIGTISAQARKLSKSMQDYGSELRGYGAWAKNF